MLSFQIYDTECLSQIRTFFHDGSPDPRDQKSFGSRIRATRLVETKNSDQIEGSRTCDVRKASSKNPSLLTSGATSTCGLLQAQSYCFTARGPSFEQFSAKNENLPHGVGLYSCECAIKNGHFGHEYEGVLINIILVFIVY